MDSFLTHNELLHKQIFAQLRTFVDVLNNLLDAKHTSSKEGIISLKATKELTTLLAHLHRHAKGGLTSPNIPNTVHSNLIALFRSSVEDKPRNLKAMDIWDMEMDGDKSSDKSDFLWKDIVCNISCILNPASANNPKVALKLIPCVGSW